MLPVLIRERSPVPTDAPPSPPAMLRVDASLVGLAGALSLLPLTLAATVGIGGFLEVFWIGGWGKALRSLAAQSPIGAGVLLPQLEWGLLRAIENLASLLVPLVGFGLGLVVLDLLRTRLRPWDPDATRWFDGSHRLLVAGGVILLYANGNSAAGTALLVPLAFWSLRPTPRVEESLRVVAGVTVLLALGMLLGRSAEVLFQVLGPVTGGIWGHLQTRGMAAAEVHRFLYMPFLRNGLAEGLARCLGGGLFLAPVTVAVTRAMRRALPAAPRLAVATLGALPAGVLCWSLLKGMGLITGHTWMIGALREVTVAAPVAQLQLWVLLGWTGCAVVPHAAAALLGAGGPAPEPLALPAEPQPSTAPGGLLLSKTSLASS